MWFIQSKTDYLNPWIDKHLGEESGDCNTRGQGSRSFKIETQGYFVKFSWWSKKVEFLRNVSRFSE